MICCKIITNFSAEPDKFGQLCEFLGKKGGWMWDGNDLFFADTEGPTDEKTVARLVKKAGYTKFYIETFDKDHEPRDNDEAKSWVADKLMKIYYLQFETENKKVLQETSRGLTELNNELNTLIREVIAEQKRSEPTEDSNNGGRN